MIGRERHEALHRCMGDGHIDQPPQLPPLRDPPPLELIRDGGPGMGIWNAIKGIFKAFAGRACPILPKSCYQPSDRSILGPNRTISEPKLVVETRPADEPSSYGFSGYPTPFQNPPSPPEAPKPEPKPEEPKPEEPLPFRHLEI